ncbi:hypothetical protein CYD53_101240 [Bosea psychrotolerans]|uniref:Uncharacterized protein n=1 Tax=Bosea psychrotolerans TaxID=1871628 RepID=A0A2S4MQ40_9HYPH|nr:hypothetical protein CYD53_101240 [Bosea psychrotolerans]
MWRTDDDSVRRTMQLQIEKMKRLALTGQSSAIAEISRP